MSIKSILKGMIAKHGGYLFGPATVPKGVDLFHDLRRFGYSQHIKTVFDIGANVGQFAGATAASLPDARLFCFEPVKSTFNVLQSSFAASPKIKVFRSAIGAVNGELRMTSKPGSVMNHILASDETPPQGIHTELVPVQTVASVAEDLGIEEINLLKTDTEGFDAHVLQGAHAMLSSGRVFLVLVEVGFSDVDKHHTPFAAVRDLLKDFDVVGFYEQGGDANFSALDRADALFIHGATARRLLPVRW
jgi:FkbM family methyltransferase